MPLTPSSARLEELQALQAAFDSTRGFDFEDALGGYAPSGSVPSESALRRLEFITLALCGEAGELANVVKKARRSAWLLGESKVSAAEIGLESADVLAYLLKLANVSGTDLRVAYLQTLCRNFLRFPVRSPVRGVARVVTLSGPSGARTAAIAEAVADGSASKDALMTGPPSVSLMEDLIEHSLAKALDGDVSRNLFLRQDPTIYVLAYGGYLFDTGDLAAGAYGGLLARLARLEIELSRWDGGRVVFALDIPHAASTEEMHQRFLSIAKLVPDHAILGVDVESQDVAARIAAALRR